MFSFENIHRKVIEKHQRYYFHMVFTLFGISTLKHRLQFQICILPMCNNLQFSKLIFPTYKWRIIIKYNSPVKWLSYSYEIIRFIEFFILLAIHYNAIFKIL